MTVHCRAYVNRFGLGYSVVGPAYNLQDALGLAVDATIDGTLLDINLGGSGASGPIAEILASRQIPSLSSAAIGRRRREDFARRLFCPSHSMERLRIAVEEMLRVAK
jgi:hypothetical protein